MLKATLENARAAAEAVKRGGLVIYPTDTVYGLGCDPFNLDAVDRLVLVKGGREKPLPILASSLSDVEKIAELSRNARKIAETFWPGPLTLVLPSRPLPYAVTFGLGTVGIRIPDHKIALELIKLSGGLLIGTSANKTGMQAPATAAEACEQLKNNVDIVLDGGTTNIRNSSTVLDLTGSKPKVLRKGPVSLEDALKLL